MMRVAKGRRWENRLAEVKSGGFVLAEYEYDGLNRRIAKIKPASGKYVRTDSYYTTSWQVIEERTDGNLDSKDTVATTLRYQYIWDIRYIDAPVCRDEDKSDGEGDEFHQLDFEPSGLKEGPPRRDPKYEVEAEEWRNSVKWDTSGKRVPGQPGPTRGELESKR